MALSILLHPPTALWRREALAASRGTFWVRMDGASSLRIYNPEPDPPDVHRAQPMDARRAEGCPVVRADRAGQADVAEEPIEHEPALLRADRSEGVTRQQIAAVLVGDRQGIAVRAIAGAEVAL